MCLQDFEYQLNPPVQYYNSPPSEISQNQPIYSYPEKNEEIEKLQQEFKLVTEKVESLEKYNTNLQDQASKYALALKDEKNEKIELLQKYDTLNADFTKKIEIHTKEKISWLKKYYTVTALLLVSVILI